MFIRAGVESPLLFLMKIWTLYPHSHGVSHVVGLSGSFQALGFNRHEQGSVAPSEHSHGSQMAFEHHPA